MSKRFRNKVCAYCGGTSQTGDHVFAKAFFLPRHRSNLPQVPACKVCNGSKASLETTLSAVMPFGGQNSTALENLTTLVPGRLAKNQRLLRYLRSDRSTVWLPNSGGLFCPSMAVPLPGQEILELFQFIARGVHAHHFGSVLGRDTFVEVVPLINIQLRNRFRAMLGWNGAARVHNILGDGTFEYEGLQGTDNPGLSIWAFEMFGGAQIADLQKREVQRLILGVMAGPRAIHTRSERAARWLGGRGAELSATSTQP